MNCLGCLRLLSAGLMLSLVAQLFPIHEGLFAKESKQVLHGAVSKEGLNLPATNGGGGPSLSRDDIGRLGDPFGGEQDLRTHDTTELLEAPQEAFQGALIKLPPAPKKSFGLGAALDEFAGQKLNVMPDVASAQSPANLAPDIDIKQGQPQSSGVNANDPDSSPELQLAWDAWHHRVAEAIFSRFNFFARAAFKFSPALAVRVSYVVSRDGRVEDVKLLQKSSNVMFNSLVTQVIKSIGGDKALLEFPQGSRRLSVEKFGTFTQNYGLEGFRYTTGDKETVSP